MKKIHSPIGVLFLLEHVDLGGGSRRIKVYCDFLDRAQFTPSVVVRTPTILRDIDGVIGENTPRLFSKDHQKILQFCKEQNVKVVYFWYDGQYHEDLYILFVLCKREGISIIANNVFSYFDEQMDALCDIVAFQTVFMLYKFSKNLPQGIDLSFEKYVLLPNPIYSTYYNKSRLTPKKRTLLRSEFGFSDSDCVVGRFGRNDIVKWGDVLLSTMLILRNEKNIKFLIVGMPRSRRVFMYLLSLFSSSVRKNVHILAPTKEDTTLFSLMQACDLIGHSVKIGEGCSNAINECLFWEKAVITNPTPHCDNGQAEQIIHNKTGILARGVKEWVHAVQELSTDSIKREMLGKNGHEFVVSHFDGDRVTKELSALIYRTQGKNVSHTQFGLTTQKFQNYVDEYLGDSRRSASVLPTSFFHKMFNFGNRIFSFLEFSLFNG